MSFDRQKHIAPQATAREISEAVGVTEADRRIVRKVLAELGYLPEPAAARGRSAKPSTRRAKAGSC
jgi:hypothetical protein